MPPQSSQRWIPSRWFQVSLCVFYFIILVCLKIFTFCKNCVFYHTLSSKEICETYLMCTFNFDFKCAGKFNLMNLVVLSGLCNQSINEKFPFLTFRNPVMQLMHFCKSMNLGEPRYEFSKQVGQIIIIKHFALKRIMLTHICSLQQYLNQ